MSLRPLAPDDARVFAAWAADVEFCRAADWSVDRPHQARVAFWRGLSQDAPPDLIRLAVIHDGAVVGYVDLHGAEPKRRELGFVIGPRDLWGRGLGGRAAAAALDHAFGDLRLDEVWAQALDANQRSVRLLQRLGMRETARGADGEFLGRPTFYRRFTVTAAQWR